MKANFLVIIRNKNEANFTCVKKNLRTIELNNGSKK